MFSSLFAFFSSSLLKRLALPLLGGGAIFLGAWWWLDSYGDDKYDQGFRDGTNEAVTAFTEERIKFVEQVEELNRQLELEAFRADRVSEELNRTLNEVDRVNAENDPDADRPAHSADSVRRIRDAWIRNSPN